VGTWQIVLIVGVVIILSMDGYLVVPMVEDGVVHMGDLFFHDHYPNIDLQAGASVQSWGDTIDEVLNLRFDVVSHGHGPVAGRVKLRR
jgi:glyoxylase-like metal-dependent hydrolase (beta-lactamase superfamily II)